LICTSESMPSGVYLLSLVLLKAAMKKSKLILFRQSAVFVFVIDGFVI